MEIVLQLLIAGLAMGSIYGLVALGFVLLVDAANIINFAQGEFVMLGAFLAYTLAALWGVPFGLSVVLAIALMAGFGLLVERLAYRPLRNAGPITVMISTLGISVFLQNAAQVVWGPYGQYFTEPFGRTILHVGDLVIQPQHLLIIVATLVLVWGQQHFFEHARLGKLMRATAQDKEMARVLGINIGAMTALTFALAAALGGIAGILVAPVFNIDARMGMMVGLKSFVASIIGGWGS
ncbi:MAG: branched-chain amino acid ABC transporter permease, partial [Chloroflexi bacterium]|nr:branched-chain amino acid ABC transporter permease [Chloroflexota bacterium]